MNDKAQSVPDKTDQQWLKEYEVLEGRAYDAKARGDLAAKRALQGQLFAMTQSMPIAALKRLAGRPVVDGRPARITEGA